MAKYCGVDLGKKKTGFSLGNDITRTARPLLTQPTPDPKGMIAFCQELVRQYRIDCFVFGDPSIAHGKDHPLESYLEEFKKLCDEHQGEFKTVWVDECYTSQLATSMAQQYPQHSRDAHAATIILQDYLYQAPTMDD